MNHKINMLMDGLNTAFIDSSGFYQSNLACKPKFISNSRAHSKKVGAVIEDELKGCDEFCFNVAFITKRGLTPLLQALKELERRNVPGKILTTDYLTFSEPEALL